MKKRNPGPMTAVAICLLFALCSGAWAGVEPSPWADPRINRLNAVAHELDSVADRLQHILGTPAERVSSAHEGIADRLEAMTHQLREIDKHMVHLVSGLPLDPASLPADVERAFRSVQERLQTISNLVGDGFSTRPVDPNVSAALENLKAAAGSILNVMVSYVYTGYQEWQPLHYVNIWVQPTCNDDCSMCGQVSLDRVKSIMDGTNALMYRSDSRVRVRPRLSFVPGGVCETIYNNNCELSPGVHVMQTTIDGEEVEVLGHYVSYGRLAYLEPINVGDWNNDGIIDDNDGVALCRPWTEDEADPGTQLGLFIQQQDHAALVFVRNGTGGITWDGVNTVWRHKRTAGASSSMGFGIAMGNGMGEWSGNSFSHELGHYLANPHPFYGYADPPPSILDQAKGRIIAARNALCPSAPLLCDPAAVVNRAFDVDISYRLSESDLSKWWVVYNQAAFGLDEFLVLDTPADPGVDLWAAIHNHDNEDHTCSYDLSGVQLLVDDIVYEAYPERTNIMSYFKSCFPQEAHFSPMQKTRSELAVAELHRKPVADVIDVKTWRNHTVTIIEHAGARTQESKEARWTWATSKIFVDDAEAGPVSRVNVGVKIYQPAYEGGLTIELIDPDGNTHVLQQPENNTPRMLHTIQSQFYINTDSKNGLWTLRVAEQVHANPGPHVDGFIADWQLQFDAP